MIWGYTGILSLGHGVYFGLGAYCMAMYLKLQADGGGLPDFMTWSGVTKLPASLEAISKSSIYNNCSNCSTSNSSNSNWFINIFKSY